MAASAAGGGSWRRKRHRELEEDAAGGTGALARANLAGKKPKRGDSADSSDSAQGHFMGKPGDVIDARYVIESEAGTGTFGRVLICRDRKYSGRTVAVKAVRSVPKYVEAAKLEASIVRDVNKRDTEGKALCVKYYRSFEWRRHFFIVTEPLGMSLYDYIKANEYKPLPLFCVQAFADQLVSAVAYLHSMELVHTDLKPENVLLQSRDGLQRRHSLTCTREKGPVLAPRSTRIRLIDFGGATYDDARKSTLINTRQYRAPEVILGHGWSMASDVWSLGCILMELYTGRLLFSTHDSHEHLALMECCLGYMPAQMRIGPTARKYYHGSSGTLRYWDKPSEESIAHVRRMRKLPFIVHHRDNVFLDLVSSLLQFDPAKRTTAAKALNHPFFTSVRKEVTPPCAAPSARRPAEPRRRSGKAAAAGGGAAAASASASAAPHDAPRRWSARRSRDAASAATEPAAKVPDLAASAGPPPKAEPQAEADGAMPLAGTSAPDEEKSAPAAAPPPDPPATPPPESAP